MPPNDEESTKSANYTINEYLLINEYIRPKTPACQELLFPDEPSVVTLAQLGAALLRRAFASSGLPQIGLSQRRQHLVSVLTMPDGRVTLEESLAIVLYRLSAHDLAEQTVVSMAKDLQAFVKTLHLHGLSTIGEVTVAHCESFIRGAFIAADGSWKDPAPQTQSRRRSAIRTLVQEMRYLGVIDGDPTLDIKVPPTERNRSNCRPATDAEIAELRAASLRTTTISRLPSILALTEATMNPGEIAAAMIGDIDLNQGTVRARGLPGKCDPRTVPLTTWGQSVVSEWVSHLDHHDDDSRPLLTTAASGPSSIGTRLLTIKTVAGLGNDKDLKPRSIIAWRVADEYRRTESLAAAARLAGIRSLDATADLIALDWRGGER